MYSLNFSPFPTLTTEHLILRQLQPGDETSIYILRSNEIVNQYLDRPRANNIEDARKHIEKLGAGINNNDLKYWAICFKVDSTLVGTICLWNISIQESKAEIGYELLPEHHGKGIMQEVIPVVIKYGFETMKLKKIEAELHANNLKSIKLLEKFKFKKNMDDSKGVENIVVYYLDGQQQ